MTQSAGQILPSFHDQRRDFFLHALRREAIGRAADGEAADHVPRIVFDGHGDGTDVLDVLAGIDGEPVLDGDL